MALQSYASAQIKNYVRNRNHHHNSYHCNMHAPTYKNAHPQAQQVMDEDFYYSSTEESGPFGSDDGSDTFAGFYAWRTGNPTLSPLIFLGEQLDSWGYPAFELHTRNQVIIQQYISANEMGRLLLTGIDAAIISVAFAQLYMEGTIEEKTRELAKIAMERQLVPEMLEHWDATYAPTRQEQLSKMIGVLNRLSV